MSRIVLALAGRILGLFQDVYSNFISTRSDFVFEIDDIALLTYVQRQ